MKIISCIVLVILILAFVYAAGFTAGRNSIMEILINYSMEESKHVKRTNKK